MTVETETETERMETDGRRLRTLSTIIIQLEFSVQYEKIIIE